MVTVFGSHQSGGNYALFLLGLFASVLLHEMAHAFVAARFGVRTTEIVMFPIGGLSRMERPLRPTEELIVSLAGPFMNLLIAAGLLSYLYSSHQPMPRSLSDLCTPPTWALCRCWPEVICCWLCSICCPRSRWTAGAPCEPSWATSGRKRKPRASPPGWAACWPSAWCLYGLFAQDFILVFFAFFIYLGAAQEGAAALGRTLTHGIPVRAAMITEFHTLGHGDTIRDAANLLLSTSQQDFPVMHGDQVVGLLGRNLLMRSLASEGPDAYVAGVMDREFLPLEPAMDLSEVLPLMAQAGRCALVMDGAKLRGLLTTDNLSEFLLLRRFGMDPVV